MFSIAWCLGALQTTQSYSTPTSIEDSYLPFKAIPWLTWRKWWQSTSRVKSISWSNSKLRYWSSNRPSQTRNSQRPNRERRSKPSRRNRPYCPLTQWAFRAPSCISRTYSCPSRLWSRMRSTTAYTSSSSWELKQSTLYRATPRTGLC